MLDRDLIEELKKVFSVLENTVECVVKTFDESQSKVESNKEDAQNLVALLQGLADSSPFIKMTYSTELSPYPEFSLRYKEKDTGIHFLGIPTGHEFTSLVLAILNADGKGKFPDQFILNRMKKIKGPIELRTIISLTCENCPAVVQALNMMALIHPQFKHTMVDGQYIQEEISKLGIGGVPSVLHEDSLVSSGKIELIDLVKKLEDHFGIDDSVAIDNKNEQLNLGQVDVLVIGAGPAGGAAAIYTARKGLKTTVIAERVGGQVKDTKGIENLISVTYTEGPLLAQKLQEHMAQYPIELLEHRRVQSVQLEGEGKAALKRIHFESGEFITARALIIATGAKWRELNIKGEKEYLGRGVAFCPHCDGPFYKGLDVAVVGGGNSGVEAAIDLSQIVKSVTLFEYMDKLKADEVLVQKLKSLPNVTIITSAKTEEVLGDGKKVTGIKYLDRISNIEKEVSLAGIFVQIGLLPNSAFMKDIVEMNRFGEIVINEKNKTNVPYIYAAGDVTTVPFKQIIISMGEGAKAGLAAFEDLTF